MSLIDGVVNSGAIPTMEAVLRFTSARLPILANNVANANTPHYRAADLDVQGFQRALSRAIQARRPGEALRFSESRNIRVRGGQPEFRAIRRPVDPLRHDLNDNAIETEMGRLHKTAMTARVMSRLLRRRYRTLRSAVSGRVI